MNINERLIQAVKTVTPICVPNFYAGKEEEYAEFEVDATPDWYWDDIPHAMRYDITLRWYMAPDKNAVDNKLVLAHALAAAGFVLQSIEDVSDELSQGYEYSLRYWEPINMGEEASPDENQG